MHVFFDLLGLEDIGGIWTTGFRVSRWHQFPKLGGLYGRAPIEETDLGVCASPTLWLTWQWKWMFIEENRHKKRAMPSTYHVSQSERPKRAISIHEQSVLFNLGSGSMGWATVWCCRGVSQEYRPKNINPFGLSRKNNSVTNRVPAEHGPYRIETQKPRARQLRSIIMYNNEYSYSLMVILGSSSLCLFWWDLGFLAFRDLFSKVRFLITSEPPALKTMTKSIPGWAPVPSPQVRWLDPQNPPQPSSQEVVGALGP